MNFQVPQFVEIEDKIFGPLSFKQFAYLAGGAGICVALYTFLPKFISFPLIAVVAGFAGALAFYRPNGQPFINTVEAAFRFLTKRRLYIWKKRQKKVERTQEEVVGPAVHVPKISDSKLKDISWSLGVKNSLYAETQKETPGSHEISDEITHHKNLQE